MRDIRKLLSGVLLGLTVVFTGCGDTNYTKGQLSVDKGTKIVYEQDGKTLANGTYNYEDNIKNETGAIVLKDGLIESLTGKKNNMVVEAKFKNKVLILVDVKENSKIEFFEDGTIKYIDYKDDNTNAIATFNKGEEFPYYLSTEVKPSNTKIFFENDTMTISKLDTKEVIETLKKTDKKVQMILSQMSQGLKYMSKVSQENIYKEVLSEISK
jgi:hypothetical protein